MFYVGRIATVDRRALFRGFNIGCVRGSNVFCPLVASNKRRGDASINGCNHV